jgi:transposase InsO family protein
MRLSLDERRLIADARRRGIKIKRVAEVLGTSFTTVKRWAKRSFFADQQRKQKKSKITMKVELAILAMRTLFRWGTARIQQGLLNLPTYAREALQNTVSNVFLSRTAINAVLTAHQLNGYLCETKHWKFFRAKRPDELWQLDLKGPFRVQGKKYWFVICIDDYSRYLLLATPFDHCPTTQEITAVLDKLPRKPRKLLTDNAKHFAEQWKEWCKDHGIEPVFAHPYYPQDKGKVERAIRNVAEEFIYLLKKFPAWLKGKMKVYQQWFNTKRFHRGIDTVPSALYGTLET